MHAFQIQPVIRLALDKYSGIFRAAARGCLGAFDIAMLGRCARGRDGAVPHYEGHAWCDSLEGQVNGDVATGRRPRL